MDITRYTLRLSVAFIIAFLVACSGPSKADLKKREVAIRDLGYEYFRAGNHTRALQKLLEAEKLYPDDHILQNYLGQVYLAKGKPEISIVHFKKAIEIKPEYAVAKNNLGFVYLSEKRWDDAIAVFKDLDGSLLYATPHYPLTNLGYAYYRKKEYQLSEHYYRKALDLEPTYPPALKGLGRTSVELGKGAEAVKALTKAVRFYPQDPEAHFELGRAYMLLGAYQNAKHAFRKVIELDPDSELANDARLALKHIR